MFTMRKYDKEFKEEAVKLSDEVGVKQAASQLGIPYYSLAEWRQKRKTFGDHALWAAGYGEMRRCLRMSGDLCVKMRNSVKQMKFSRTPLVFSQKTGRSEA